MASLFVGRFKVGEKSAKLGQRWGGRYVDVAFVAGREEFKNNGATAHVQLDCGKIA